MNNGIKTYIFIFAFLVLLWNIILGYFPFLICIVFVFLFLFNIVISYQGMKTTTITSSIKNKIVERNDELEVSFQRHATSIFPIGKIGIEYRIYDAWNQCVIHKKVFLEDQEYIEILILKHSGYYYLQIEQIYCFDILQCLYRKHNLSQQLQFYVFPSLIQTPILFQENLSQCYESIEYSPNHQGEDYSEMFDIRAYQAGDTLKHIHWNASLKQNELLVKEGSQPTIKKILLAVQMTNINYQNDKALDYFYSICSSLSQKQIAYEILCPQMAGDLLQRELITNDEFFRECLKRLLKTPTQNIENLFYQSQDMTSFYLINFKGIEVYEK